MFGLQTLDVIIGLVFVYTILSLVVSAANELVAQIANLRGRTLSRGIRALLEEPADRGGKKKRPVSAGEARAPDAAASTPSISADALHAHPLIASLRVPGRFRKDRWPSYIPSQTFAASLLDLIAPADASGPKSVAEIRAAVHKLPDHIRRPLLVIINGAQDDLRAVQIGIERWFNDAMERVSGLYKRRIQWIILAISVAVAVGANADSMRIWRALSSSATLRATVVADAERFLANPPPASTRGTTPANVAGQPAPAAQLSIDPVLRAADRIDSLAVRGVPLGWDKPPRLSSVPGLLITAFAISLGAPFWFDVLNKVVNIRAAGRAPEEKPKSPEALPPPRGA